MEKAESQVTEASHTTLTWMSVNNYEHAHYETSTKVKHHGYYNDKSFLIHKQLAVNDTFATTFL